MTAGHGAMLGGRNAMFFLVELNRYGADGEAHPGLDLNRQLAGIIREPDKKAAFALIDDVVEYERLVTDGFERTGFGLHLLADLRFDADRSGFLAVAHRQLRGLSGV